MVWKQIDSALEGEGDIDSAADPADWDALEHEFRVWAETDGLEPVAICNHIPGGRNLIAAPERMTSFLELSIKHNKVFRGSMLFTLDELAPLTILDYRGFRRVRPGAEGLLKLVLNGSRWGGRPNFEGLRTKHVAELLDAGPRRRPTGARCSGRRRRPCSPSPTACRPVAGTAAMIKVDGAALIKAARHPRTLARRAWFRAFSTEHCPVVKAILTGGRLIPGTGRPGYRNRQDPPVYGSHGAAGTHDGG